MPNKLLNLSFSTDVATLSLLPNLGSTLGLYDVSVRRKQPLVGLDNEKIANNCHSRLAFTCLITPQFGVSLVNCHSVPERANTEAVWMPRGLYLTSTTSEAVRHALHDCLSLDCRNEAA